MAQDSSRPAQIAHILFLDIIGWSRESIEAQGRLLAELSKLVTECPTYRTAKAEGELLAFPSGDGMWILFTEDLAAPARCAMELMEYLKRAPTLAIRMGIHSGPVRFQTDIAGTQTVVGDGINTAKRVMDMGDRGLIVMSGQYASWLKQFDQWSSLVHEFGEGVTKHGEKILLYTLAAEPSRRSSTSAAKSPLPEIDDPALKVVLVYKRNAQPDDEVLAFLEDAIRGRGHSVFIDRHMRIGIEWAKEIEERIRAADAVIAIVSDAALGSEMLEYELEIATEENRKRGKPYLLPVRVGANKKVEGPVGAYVNGLNFSVWQSAQDNERVLAEIRAAMTAPPKSALPDRPLEPVGGAVPPDSPFYAERASDEELARAIRANESIILIKGPRQVGKTSLIGRGTKLVHELGWRHVSTDFQKLSTAQMSNDDTFYRLLAATVARQLKTPYDFAAEWIDVFGANMNMDNFVREILESSTEPLVWFMDEADKIFAAPFASDFFGLVRSWHNSRATEPHGPWARFTVVIGYATEAHLFIQDLNQSPFNVGRQIPLRNFTLDQMRDLNERYGRPVNKAGDLERLHQLVGGQPFLVRRALDVLARKQYDFGGLIAAADHDDGPFGDHLKRVLISVTQLPSVLDALRASLTEPAMTSSDGVQRLIAASVLRQSAEHGIGLSCDLYRNYLAQHV